MIRIIKFFLIDIISIFVYVGICIKGLVKKNNSARVILYHSISKDSISDKIEMEVTSHLFENQIKYLLRNNFRFINVYNLIHSLKEKKSNDFNRSILITFDDGFFNNYLYALPILEKYGIKAVFFITVQSIDNGNFNWLSGYNFGRPLKWDEVSKISSKGHVIGSHTVSHKNLLTLNDSDLKKELCESKKIIEENIKKEVKYFSYPFGFYDSFDDRTKTMCKDAGYEAAFSNILGEVKEDSDLYELKRLRISEKDTGPRLLMKLAGAYDWLDSLKRVV